MTSASLVIHGEAGESPAADTDQGGWQWQTVQRSTGPFTDLIQALRAPAASNASSGRPSTPAPPTAVCPAVAAAPIVITLTDGAGRTVTPAIPATACGLPDPAVQQAIDRITWTTVKTQHAQR